MARITSSRRDLLVKLSASGVAAAAGVGALGAPQVRPEPAPEQYVDADELDVAAPIVGPDGGLAPAAPVPRWQHARTADGYVPTSPINAVIALGPERQLGDVRSVFETHGWHSRPEEYVRYARAPDGSFELTHASVAETLLGTATRLHARCWSFDGVVSVQVHQDSVPLPEHSIDSYHRARDALEGLFAAEAWTVAPAAVDAENDSPPDHDGHLTVIEP